MATSYYRLLGISDREPQRSIPRAYRDLARDCFPERTPPGGTQHFSALRRAFDVLSAPGRRRTYDRTRNTAARPVERHHPAPVLRTLCVVDEFDSERPSRDEIRDAFRQNFSRQGLPKSGRTRALGLDVIVDRGELDDSEVTVIGLEFPVYRPCPACHGSGYRGASACQSCDHGTREASDQTHIEVPGDAGARDRSCERSLSDAGVHNLVLRVRLRVTG